MTGNAQASEESSIVSGAPQLQRASTALVPRSVERPRQRRLNRWWIALIVLPGATRAAFAIHE